MRFSKGFAIYFTFMYLVNKPLSEDYMSSCMLVTGNSTHN